MKSKTSLRALIGLVAVIAVVVGMYSLAIASGPWQVFVFDFGHNPIEFTDGDGEVFTRFLDWQQQPLPDEEGFWYSMEYIDNGTWEFDEDNWFPVPSEAAYYQLDIVGAAAGNPIFTTGTYWTNWEVDF